MGGDVSGAGSAGSTPVGARTLAPTRSGAGQSTAFGSRIRAVHQILPSLHVADASGTHTLRAREALRRAGYVSEIFVEHVDPPLASQAHHIDQLDAHGGPGTALLYQLSVGSAVVDRLLARSEPLLVDYHNLTPASFFWEWAPDWLDAVALGWRQLHRLAPRALHAMADSAFNEADLVSAGYRSTSVVPPLVDVGVAGAAGSWPRRRWQGHGARWLFVGKLLPHKGAHRLVQAFAAYREAYDPEAHLVLVGGAPIAAYRDAVVAYADDLGVGRSVSLAGAVSDEALARRYATADVLVCLSAHEGFCFPLVEAMAHGLPVVAARAGAVGDTLDGAGILLRSPRPSQVAAAVHRVLTDADLRGRLAARGRARLADFAAERSASRFVAEVGRALAGGAR